jgi:hypothetical protein
MTKQQKASISIANGITKISTKHPPPTPIHKLHKVIKHLNFKWRLLQLHSPNPYQNWQFNGWCPSAHRRFCPFWSACHIPLHASMKTEAISSPKILPWRWRQKISTKHLCPRTKPVSAPKDKSTDIWTSAWEVEVYAKIQVEQFKKQVLYNSLTTINFLSLKLSFLLRNILEIKTFKSAPIF